VTLLTRDAILAAQDREYDTVDCPEWGGAVRLASISGTQRDKYESSLIEQRGNDHRMNLRNARAKLIVACAVDEQGNKLFSEDDVNALGRKSAKPLERLFDACRRLTGLSDDDVDKLTEDFGDAQSDGSTTV